MIVHFFFTLLHKTNDKSDCSKTFDTFESQSMVIFGNIFGIIYFLINNVYFESFIL